MRRSTVPPCAANVDEYGGAPSFGSSRLRQQRWQFSATSVMPASGS
jgi:hypothetical protein